MRILFTYPFLYYIITYVTINCEGRNMARPKEEDEILSIRLAKKHVSMLDAHVTNELMRTAPLRPDGMPTPKTIANARRRYLGQLIEDNLSLEALHPVEIKIIAPIAGHQDIFREGAKWIKEQKERLEREAPEPIKWALETNKEIREYWMRVQDGKTQT